MIKCVKSAFENILKHIYVNIYKYVLLIFYSILSIRHGNERTIGPTY
jgi:hypothetical protein